MATITYDSFTYDMAGGQIVIGTDTFKAMLVTSAYTENKGTHTKRSDITNEVANGNGYTTGGATVVVTRTNDTVNHRLEVTIADPAWPSSTITARKCVVYKSRGGAASADELVCCADLGADITSTNGTFTVDFTTPIRINNP